MHTQYSFDLSALIGLVTLVFLVFGAIAAYFSAQEKHRPAVKGAAIALLVLCPLFAAYLFVIHPPQRQSDVKDSKVAEELSSLRKTVENVEDTVIQIKRGQPTTFLLPPKIIPDPTPVSPMPSPNSTASACETAAAKAIAKMITRCGTHFVCPVNITQDLGEATEEEQHHIMATLSSVALFFPSGVADLPASKLAEFDAFVGAATPTSTLIIISRSSRTGPADVNKDLSRRRLLFASHRVDAVAPKHAMVLASYSQDTLYLTERNAKLYNISPDQYGDVLRLNQSVFAFRFDCPVGS